MRVRLLLAPFIGRTRLSPSIGLAHVAPEPFHFHFICLPNLPLLPSSLAFLPFLTFFSCLPPLPLLPLSPSFLAFLPFLSCLPPLPFLLPSVFLSLPSYLAALFPFLSLIPSLLAPHLYPFCLLLRISVYLPFGFTLDPALSRCSSRTPRLAVPPLGFLFRHRQSQPDASQVDAVAVLICGLRVGEERLRKIDEIRERNLGTSLLPL